MNRSIIAYLVSTKRICVVSRWSEWTTRNRRAHGFNSMTCVVTRPVTESDTQEDHPYRLSYWKYGHWAQVIEDEIALGTPTAFIDQLTTLATQHRIFPATPLLEREDSPLGRENGAKAKKK